jgi:cell division protein ZipA
MSDANLLRLIIAAFGAMLIAALYFFGRPRKPDQGRMKPAAPRRAPASAGGRVEPHIGDGPADIDEAGSPTIEIDGEQLELPSLRAEPVDDVALADALPPSSTTGRRPADARFERIVTLYVAARDGGSIAGPELVVAAEKVGLEYGDMGIFHRLVENRPDLGPVFSVASMVKPGSFDMARIGELRTPGLTFFMTLPGPASALDAWDAMLPAAQRFAELLDAQVLDAEHNALGRQTIQHLRDDLRAFDRAQERNVIKPRR